MDYGGTPSGTKRIDDPGKLAICCAWAILNAKRLEAAHVFGPNVDEPACGEEFEVIAVKAIGNDLVRHDKAKADPYTTANLISPCKLEPVAFVLKLAFVTLNFPQFIRSVEPPNKQIWIPLKPLIADWKPKKARLGLSPLHSKITFHCEESEALGSPLPVLQATPLTRRPPAILVRPITGAGADRAPIGLHDHLAHARQTFICDGQVNSRDQPGAVGHEGYISQPTVEFNSPHDFLRERYFHPLTGFPSNRMERERPVDAADYCAHGWAPPAL